MGIPPHNIILSYPPYAAPLFLLHVVDPIAADVPAGENRAAGSAAQLAIPPGGRPRFYQHEAQNRRVDLRRTRPAKLLLVASLLNFPAHRGALLLRRVLRRETLGKICAIRLGAVHRLLLNDIACTSPGSWKAGGHGDWLASSTGPHASLPGCHAQGRREYLNFDHFAEPIDAGD